MWSCACRLSTGAFRRSSLLGCVRARSPGCNRDREALRGRAARPTGSRVGSTRRSTGPRPHRPRAARSAGGVGMSCRCCRSGPAAGRTGPRRPRTNRRPRGRTAEIDLRLPPQQMAIRNTVLANRHGRHNRVVVLDPAAAHAVIMRRDSTPAQCRFGSLFSRGLRRTPHAGAPGRWPCSDTGVAPP